MIVPNYVPEAIEIPGNVTEQPYRERLIFIRRVSILHLASVAFVGGVVAAQTHPLPIKQTVIPYAVFILGLSLLRIRCRGDKLETQLSSYALPILLLLAGMVAASLIRWNFPVWSAGVGVACGVLYTLSCGRDFSFVGQFFLGLIASTLIISVTVLCFGLPPRTAALALGWNLVSLFYYCYDLASLLSRRRIGEEIAGVVDLYRDVLNVFGWVIRVAQHWHRHSIFTIPLIEPRKPTS